MTRWPYPGMNEQESIQYDIDEIEMQREEVLKEPEDLGKCDWCPKRAVTKWREGRGTGHSESVSACNDHRHFEHE